MYDMYDKNGKPGMIDIKVSEKVATDTEKAMAKIEIVQKGLEKDSIKAEDYKREYNKMKEIHEEAKNNCKRRKIFS